ncbi:hypothetical protein D9Q98_005973 [Chlorella vulgaris]|uniref:SGNH hydrolase-type esterase domain-containing protein n=1 Tax=Chlorella vulgaris TaxID=3077 RepID=A0A9D4TWT2_CHLVU|nr:hypothetical protein D9Q98_005973 [Chlorella vulgaris]
MCSWKLRPRAVSTGRSFLFGALLTAARGLAYYGSGARIERVAGKLLDGQRIKAFTIGGSVTSGAGASDVSRNYASRFFHFINTTFPHSDHVLVNKGIGGTTSGIFSLCAEAMLPPDTDLVVAEFTFNEPGEQPYTSPQRRAFEQLLRKLAQLPDHPAVVVLHHYAWYFSSGDGVDAGLYYRAAETQFSTMAQYYDMPSPSVRSAVWPMMQTGVAPFKVSHVLKASQVSPEGLVLPVAQPGTEGDYFYYDKVHPSDVGHQVMAELLAGVMMQAVQNVASASASAAAAATIPAGMPVAANLLGGSSSSSSSDGSSSDGSSSSSGGSSSDGSSLRLGSQPKSNDEQASGVEGGSEQAAPELMLLPPMIPGNADVPTTVCAIQERLKPLGKAMEGFAYLPERPNATSFVEQKWGYSGLHIGDWIELEVSTADSSADAGQWCTLYLGFLRSYQGMGLARVVCKSGCECAESLVEAQWRQLVSLTQTHSFQVTQHPKCRLRLTIVERANEQTAEVANDGSSTQAAATNATSIPSGSKFQLSSVMVAHFPVVLDNRIAGTAGGLSDHG